METAPVLFSFCLFLIVSVQYTTIPSTTPGGLCHKMKYLMMHEFFRGWRRKAGLVTLVLACAFLGLWFRSFSTTDDCISFPHNYSLYSHDGSISWNVHDISLGDSAVDFGVVAEGSEQQIGRGFELFHPKVYNRWECCGLVYSDTSFAGSGRVRQYWISAWYFISPLTVLSAWLLLSKRRQPKSTNAADLMHEGKPEKV